MAKKILKGTVVSNKMTHTLVVKVSRITKHPKYKKRFTVSKRYQVHYNDGDYQIGDKVMIEETKPISRHKKWTVIGLDSENLKSEVRSTKSETNSNDQN